MTSPVRVPLSTCESVRVRLHADSDPTAETVEFYFTDGSDMNQPTNAQFIAGSWVAGSWDSRSGWSEANTHTVGASVNKVPSQLLGAAGVFRLWARVVTATQAPVIDCGTWEFY